MVEGFLLQVTLPETEQLYKYLLYKLAPLPASSAPSGKSTEQDQSSARGSPHKKVTRKKVHVSHVMVVIITFRYNGYLLFIYVNTEQRFQLQGSSERSEQKDQETQGKFRVSAQ